MKESASHQETDLLHRIASDDEQAIALLMRKYYSDLYNYASRFTKLDAVIKDCIQEVFISLWQRRGNATAILSLKFYLLRAIKNKILKAVSREQRHKSDYDLPEDYDFIHDFSIEKMIIARQVSEENARRITIIIQRLSKREREVIYLKYYQHFDNAQIAELMNISRQSVYNLLHESISKLRALWHKDFVT